MLIYIVPPRLLAMAVAKTLNVCDPTLSHYLESPINIAAYEIADKLHQVKERHAPRQRSEIKSRREIKSVGYAVYES